jgi:hypothetical protein
LRVYRRDVVEEEARPLGVFFLFGYRLPGTLNMTSFERFHIETEDVPDIVPWPSRFKVKVGKAGLTRLLLRELIQYRGDLDVVLSRPCLYGVFSGPVGGYSPREEYCVGCLRCTVQYPQFVEVRPNPERTSLGDSYFDFHYVNAIAYEASTGSVPVKGAGYGGRFGGEGWDGMWTDMSEIVRPTRDGIHGREYISTAVDIGRKPDFLMLDGNHHPNGDVPRTFGIPLPILLESPGLYQEPLPDILAGTAAEIDSLAILPIDTIIGKDLHGPNVVPRIRPEEMGRLPKLRFKPRLIEMDGWSEPLLREIREFLGDVLVGLRCGFDDGNEMLSHADSGIDIFHLTADFHGRSADGRFVAELIREAHQRLVSAGRRDEVTLIGSGGIIAAEHVPKAIINGLDAVVINTPVLVALQARFRGEYTHPEANRCWLPEEMTVEWGIKRVRNMVAAWRDQLLEVLGAMGLREVRRLRGEIGRAMLQNELEQEAFAGIKGYGEKTYERA